MANDKASILARMKALAERTTANGCTEAEALQASEKLGELADRYGFSMVDVAESEREPIGEETWFSDSKRLGDVAFCTNAIGAFCDCKVWTNFRYVEMMGCSMQHVVFFGRESDGMIATYLTHLFHTAIKSAWAEYIEEHPGVDVRSHRKGFHFGMTNRISERLHEMKAARNVKVDEPTGKRGHDLVVVKNAEVEAAFALLGFKISVRKVRFSGDRGAYSAGRAAGDRVGIHSGITNSSSQARIGHG